MRNTAGLGERGDICTERIGGHMKNWLKRSFLGDFIGVFRSVRDMRRSGERGALMIVPEKDFNGMLAEEKRWTAIREKEKELAIRCVEHMIQGGSACMYCEERKECNGSRCAEADKRGCKGWWLRYLTEEEQPK